MGSSRILSMMDDGEPRRSNQRRRVMLVARLSTSSKSYEVRLRDISPTGARIEGAELPSQGSSVMLTRGVFTAWGRLVWVDGQAGGVLFDDALDEDIMMETLKGVPANAPVPEPYRRPGVRGGTHARFSDGRGWIDAPNFRR